MPTIDIADSFGRRVIETDGSRRAEKWALSFVAWALGVSLLAEAPAASCYPWW